MTPPKVSVPVAAPRTSWTMRATSLVRDLVSLPARNRRDDPGAAWPDYPVWIRQEAPTWREALQAQADLRRSAARLRFEVVVVVAGVDGAAALATCGSVLAQTWPGWRLGLSVVGVPDGPLGEFMAEAPGLDARIRVCSEPAGAPWRAALGTTRADFVVLVNPGDLLAPGALATLARAASIAPGIDVLFADEDRLTEAGERCLPRFKPAWSPALLEATPYLGVPIAVRRRIARAVAAGPAPIASAPLWDLALRATGRARQVVRVPQVLAHRPLGAAEPVSAGAVPEDVRQMLRMHCGGARGGVEVAPSGVSGIVRVRRPVDPAAAVTIIIPTRDRADLVRTCLDTLRSTSHRARAVLLVDNGSREPATLALFAERQRQGEIRVVRDERPFNFSALNNAAARQATTPFVLFLNNDIEVIEPHWLSAMLEYATLPDVGAVGARLLYPDRRLQHGGVVLGKGGHDALSGVACHPWSGAAADGPPPHLAGAPREQSALTAACLLVRRTVFEEVGGFDEGLAVAFNDVDLGLRIRAAGYRLVYTPFATLVHHESASRARAVDPEETTTMLKRWGPELLDDPYTSPNLSLIGLHEHLRLRPEREVVAAALQSRRIAARRGAGRRPARVRRPGRVRR